MRPLIAAARFLTRLPLPGPPTEADELPRAVPWFPIIGALIGALIGLAFWAFSSCFPIGVAAVLALAVGVLLTGAFHEDAAADSADGLGGGWQLEDVLRIMKDSRVGSYGAVALWLLLSLKWAVMVTLPEHAWVALMVAGTWGRWSAAPLLRVLPPIGEGVGRDIAGALPDMSVRLATVVALALTVVAWFFGSWRPLLAPLFATAVVSLWAMYLHRRVGGQTGDLLGAGNQLVECAVLLIFVAKT